MIQKPLNKMEQKLTLEQASKIFEKEYGPDRWPKVQNYITDLGGWCIGMYSLKHPKDQVKKLESGHRVWRPWSLRGLEINNGWTRINSIEEIQEYADTDARAIHVCHIDNATFDIVDGKHLVNWFEKGWITHYVKPICRPMPLY